MCSARQFRDAEDAERLQIQSDTSTGQIETTGHGMMSTRVSAGLGQNYWEQLALETLVPGKCPPGLPGTHQG